MELYSLEEINRQGELNKGRILAEERAEAAERARLAPIMAARLACGCDLCQCGLPHGTDPEWI